MVSWSRTSDVCGVERDRRVKGCVLDNAVGARVEKDFLFLNLLSFIKMNDFTV